MFFFGIPAIIWRGSKPGRGFIGSSGFFFPWSARIGITTQDFQASPALFSFLTILRNGIMRPTGFYTTFVIPPLFFPQYRPVYPVSPGGGLFALARSPWQPILIKFFTACLLSLRSFQATPPRFFLPSYSSPPQGGLAFRISAFRAFLWRSRSRERLPQPMLFLPRRAMRVD